MRERPRNHKKGNLMEFFSKLDTFDLYLLSFLAVIAAIAVFGVIQRLVDAQPLFKDYIFVQMPAADPDVSLVLQPGERYAGIVLDAEEDPDYHLILTGDFKNRVTWRKAIDWASENGGALPNERDALMLCANFPFDFHGGGTCFIDDAEAHKVYDFGTRKARKVKQSTTGTALRVRRILIKQKPVDADAHIVSSQENDSTKYGE